MCYWVSVGAFSNCQYGSTFQERLVYSVRYKVRCVGLVSFFFKCVNRIVA